MNSETIRPTALDVIRGHDLHGCNALITGGAGALGLETARALMRAGARVFIADEEHMLQRAEAALAREAGARQATLLPLDLASLDSVRAFCASFLARGLRLHLLINNAGVMAMPLTYTSDGYELHFAVNYLGHFALTLGLLPALVDANGARVVMLTTIAHRRSGIMFDDIHYRARPYDAWQAYGQSGTANVLFGVAFSERYAAQGITASAVMPGGILSGIQRHLPRETMIELGWIDEQGVQSTFLKSPEQGAASIVWAAVADELAGRGGFYIQNCGIAGLWQSDEPLLGYVPHARDTETARRLWKISEMMLRV